MWDSHGLRHEHITIGAGARSGLPIIIAIHSTALGDAVGGCRVWWYPDWRDGLADALALSEAMSLKCAAAGLDFGGGKSVVVLPPGATLAGERRERLFLDFGDAVDALGGRYRAGEDVGTTAEDMWVARQRTPWAYCLPEDRGGAGDPSELTAVGTFSAIGATWRQVSGSASLRGQRVTVIGLGHVGGRLARLLAEAGAELTVTDIDARHKELAASLGARWAEPDAALTAPAEIVVPAALGGLLTADVIPSLRCAAIAGPANNQLADIAVADALAERGIVWAPDFVANAGGVIHGAITDIGGGSPAEARAAATAIGERLSAIYAQAASSGQTPYAVAMRAALDRIATARRVPLSLAGYPAGSLVTNVPQSANVVRGAFGMYSLPIQIAPSAYVAAE